MTIWRNIGAAAVATVIATLAATSHTSAAVAPASLRGLQVRSEALAQPVSHSRRQIWRGLERRGYYDIDLSSRYGWGYRAAGCRHGDRFRLRVDHAGRVSDSRPAGACRHAGSIERIDIGRSRGGRTLRIEGPFHSIGIRLH